MKIISYGKQYVDRHDQKEVSKSIRQQLITTGPLVKKFESLISKKTGSKFALTCNSGTSALHLAFNSIGFKKNDVIIMPSINFIASYSLAKMMSLKIFLTDVDPKTGQMTPGLLEKCIKDNRLKTVKAVITMHLGGFAENIEQYYKLKKKYRFLIIEDACHALGAKHFHKKKKIEIGSCRFSDIACFSLHPLKTITTGEGGLVTTNNKFFYNNMKLFRSHGILRKEKSHWEYDIKNLGLNYRLSDINCALGISQLKKINKFISFRKKVYNYYNKKLSIVKEKINFPKYQNTSLSSFHLAIVNIDFKKINKSKNQLFKHFKKEGIYLQFHYIPIYRFSIYPNNNKNNFYGSETYYKNAVSLPIYYNIKRRELDRVINNLLTFVQSK